MTALRYLSRPAASAASLMRNTATASRNDLACSAID